MDWSQLQDCFNKILQSWKKHIDVYLCVSFNVVDIIKLKKQHLFHSKNLDEPDNNFLFLVEDLAVWRVSKNQLNQFTNPAGELELLSLQNRYIGHHT